MVTVFLVDDHEVVRRGLVGLLSADPELGIVGEAGSVADRSSSSDPKANAC
jgi:two-component system response regulator DevR